MSSILSTADSNQKLPSVFPILGLTNKTDVIVYVVKMYVLLHRPWFSRNCYSL